MDLKEWSRLPSPSFSLCPLTIWPRAGFTGGSSWQSRVNKALTFWPQNHKGELQKIRKNQGVYREGEAGKLLGCFLSCACMDLILNSMKQDFEDQTETDYLLGPRLATEGQTG